MHRAEQSSTIKSFKNRNAGQEDGFNLPVRLPLLYPGSGQAALKSWLQGLAEFANLGGVWRKYLFYKKQHARESERSGKEKTAEISTFP